MRWFVFYYTDDVKTEVPPYREDVNNKKGPVEQDPGS
ncbi:hypothetical protein SAMN04488122_6469 [Chitinophaga arvensicola]|uniref:Uncharacterized protein n=1 Tax=Chitinophaga arvensicola TaxID=29529 RepID=A0A1I0SD16_9BACT|nr:hypothetical protein SAMN04488122_6469 [Chitinophaga arvensicola]